MARVFISYRHTEPDATVARRLYERLHALNHEVFFDFEKLKVGDRWNREIRKALDEAEYFVGFVSLSYLHSKFILTKELRRAARRLKSGSLKGFLHVNLAYDGDPPKEVRDVLSAIQYVKWRGPDDTESVIQDIVSEIGPSDLLIRGAQAYSEADAAGFERLGRTERVDEFLRVLRERDQPVLLHGVSGAGKTSFLQAGVVSQLEPGEAAVIELTSENAEDVAAACGSARIVCFDQFEQSLMRIAEDAQRCAAFQDALLEAAPQVRLVFCIRDEYRTAFEQLLPAIARGCVPFALLPFSAAQAATVLTTLLKNGRVAYDADFIPQLCASVAEGVPPTVLPAILQVIVQQCRARGLALNSATWRQIAGGEGADVFEEHVRERVIDQVPRAIRMDALRTLVALTAGDVKSARKRAPEIATDGGVQPSRAQRALDVAAGRARVVTVEPPQTAGDEPRYRLAHDLYVAPVRRLHDRAVRQQTQWRNAAIAAIVALSVVTASITWIVGQIGVRNQRRETASRIGSNAVIQFADRDASALLFGRAYATADARDPRRPLYAIAAIHQTVVLPPPIVRPKADYRAVLFAPYSHHVVMSSSRRQSIVVTGHGGWQPRVPTSRAESIAVSDDGSRVAVVEDGNTGGTVPIHQSSGGRVRLRDYNYAYAEGVRFNGDGSVLFVREYDKRTGAWDARSGARIGEVVPGVLLEDGKAVMTPGRERALRDATVVDLRSGAPIASLPIEDPFHIAFLLPNGDEVVIGRSVGSETHFEIWSVRSLSMVESVRVPGTSTRIADASADGRIVLVKGSPDLHVWNRNRRSIEQVTCRGFNPDVDGLARDGSIAICGTASGTPSKIGVWSTSPVREIHRAITPPRSLQARATADRSMLRTLRDDGTVYEFSLRERLQELASASKGSCARHVTFSADASQVLVVSDPPCQPRLSLVSLRGGAPAAAPTIARLSTPTAFGDIAGSGHVASTWEADGKMFVQFVDLQNGSQIYARPIEVSGPVEFAALDPSDGSALVIVGNPEHTAGRVLRIGRDHVIQKTYTIAAPVFGARLDASGRTLIHIDERGRARIRMQRIESGDVFETDLPADVALATVEAFLDHAAVEVEGPTRVVIQRFGRRFRMEKGPDQLQVTDGETGAPLVLPRLSKFGNFDWGALTRDGTLLALTLGNVIGVFDLSRGELVARLSNTIANCDALAFVDDDTALAVLHEDGVVRRHFIGDRKRAARYDWIEDLVEVAVEKRLDGATVVTLTAEEIEERRKRLATALGKADDPNEQRVLEYLRANRILR